MSDVLWQPSDETIEQALKTAFHRRMSERHGVRDDSVALDRFSVDRPDLFWPAVWEDAGIIGDGPGEAACVGDDRMPGAVWFPMASLNFSENLLRRDDDSPAIIFRSEIGARREISWRTLRADVAAWAAAYDAHGLEPGDRVAAYMPNVPETVIAMLGAASRGLVWSSCSPDFGPAGVLDRFGQIEPRMLITTDGYHYGGKTFSNIDRAREVLARLPSVEKTVVVAYANESPDITGVPGAVLESEFLAEHRGTPFAPKRYPFNHALYILFSSGTTGAPKCIVHSAGGTLIQHVKEHRLHCDIHPGDRVFYYTTCGWMMWNWLVSALACEATIVLFDGSPMHPKGDILFDVADEEDITLFGTSAKYIDALKKNGFSPMKTHGLESLRTITSTGSPLVPESFDYVYESIKKDVHLASISGGTDIVSCFVLGDPTRPVHRGEIQTRGLGMDVDIFDDEGRPLRGDKGELVCKRPFPSMPLGFWNDPGLQRYRGAYFNRFPLTWTHGDFAEITENGGFIIHGRSDAVLNPGGVRIGTAEIYRVVEQLENVTEAIVIGQDHDDDVRVVLFCKMTPGHELDADAVSSIRSEIRARTTPRHVPKIVLAVDDIPRTKSGKISEIAVRDVVHGREVKNKEALANPEALDNFVGRAELA